MGRATAITAAAIVMTCIAPARAEDSQASVAASAGSVVKAVHAVGAQIYECKADGHGGLAWSFREPVASLMAGGKTVGRHFAGPTWEMDDGSRVVGKVIARAPGTSADDVPWLKLTVSDRKGGGTLDGVTVVQRVATVGGSKDGACSPDGAFLAVPYAADYVFSRP